VAGLVRLTAGCLVMLAVPAGCADTSGDRFDTQSATTQAVFGEDDRISVTVSPGRLICAAERGATSTASVPAGATVSDFCAGTLGVGEGSASAGAEGHGVAVRASSPFPEVLLDNGTTRSQRILLRVANLGSLAVEAPILQPLRPDARLDPACEQVDSTLPLYLAPLVPTSLDATTRLLEVELPACRTLRLPFRLDPSATRFRIAVVGPSPGSDEVLRAAVRDAREWPADFVLFVGGVFSPGTSEPAARLFDLVESGGTALQVPYGLVMGAEERDSGTTAFYERLGPTDFTSSVGVVRLLSLDTSDRLVTEGQLDFVEGLRASAAPSIAFMYAPPYAPRSLAPDGIRDPQLAARLFEALRQAGVDHLFAGSDGGATTAFGAMAIHEVADAGRSGGATYARVLIEGPWPRAPLCRAGACDEGSGCVEGVCLRSCATGGDCDADRPLCVAGACRTPCTADADCPDLLPVCEAAAGVCAESPRVTVELRRPR
jgi:hypothetical protein